MAPVSADRAGWELSVKQPVQWENMAWAAFRSVNVFITPRATLPPEPAAAARDITATPVNTAAPLAFLEWPVLRLVTAEWGRRVTTGQGSAYVHQDIMDSCANDDVKLAVTEPAAQSHVTAQAKLLVTH